MSADGGRLAVGVLGATGRMGALVCSAIGEQPDLALVARVGRGDSRDPLRLASVVVDFTHPDAVMANIRWCLDHRRHLVVGTSGMDGAMLGTLREWLAECPQLGVIVAPTFSVSAALAMGFAVRAARYFGAVEIIEYAHTRKADAPSGTARQTAELIVRARHERRPVDAAPPDGLGAGFDADRVPIHSIRMDGFVSHQDVRLNRVGEELTIRFDTTDRRAYLPGILAAVRAAPHRPGLTIGIETLIGLSEIVPEPSGGYRRSSRLTLSLHDINGSVPREGSAT